MTRGVENAVFMMKIELLPHCFIQYELVAISLGWILSISELQSEYGRYKSFFFANVVAPTSAC